MSAGVIAGVVIAGLGASFAILLLLHSFRYELLKAKFQRMNRDEIRKDVAAPSVDDFTRPAPVGFVPRSQYFPVSHYFSFVVPQECLSGSLERR